MKQFNPLHTIVLAWSIFLSSASWAVEATLKVPETEFTKYHVSADALDCKPLDFNSYHKVQNVKGNMLRLNPNLQHPNFAGKYLLLKNEFLFETVWFVADCASGKFIPDMFSSDHDAPTVQFKADSELAVFSGTGPKNNTPSEYHVFRDGKWSKVESPALTSTPSPSVAPITNRSGSPAAFATPSSSPSPGLPTVGSTPFTDYPVSVDSTCKEPDYASHSRAQNVRKALIQANPNRTQPNFGGHYLLLKGESLFQTYWLLADCRDGKINAEILTGNADFKKDSRLLKIHSAGSFPVEYLWNDEDQQWIKFRSGNLIYGKNTNRLYQLLSKSEPGPVIRFSQLKCETAGCSVVFGNQPKALDTVETEWLNRMLKNWSADGVIQSGKCKQENGKITCELQD